MSMHSEELSREFDSATDKYLAEHDLIRLPVDNTGRAFHPGESIIHPQGTVMYIDDICFQLEDKEHQCTYTVPFSDMSEFVHDQSTLSELAEILVKQTDRVLDYIENPTQVPLIDVYNALNHIDFIAKNIANRAEKE